MYSYTVIMASQKDVAKEAKVSSATVSRYINNPESVSLETASRIRKAIKKLDYRMDYSALSLKTGKYYRVGIVSASIGPFYMEVLSTIEENLSDAGYFANISFSREKSSNNNVKNDLLFNKQADGFLLFPLLSKQDDKIIQHLNNIKEKFVIIDRTVEDESICQVKIDNYEAGYKAARVLIEKGHKKFLFIWGMMDVESSHERFKGYSDALTEVGIILDETRQIKGEFGADYTYSTVKKHFTELPEFTAVFASNDLSALGFMKAAHKFGMSAPKDYSIIGFDNDRFSPYVEPSLSTFQQPLKTMGNVASKMLIDILNGRKIYEKQIILKTKYIERESVRSI